MSSPANPDEMINEEKNDVIAKASAECRENLMKMVEAQEVLNNQKANESPDSYHHSNQRRPRNRACKTIGSMNHMVPREELFKVVKCDQCNRKYANIDSLNKHKLTHSTVSPSSTKNLYAPVLNPSEPSTKKKDQERGKTSEDPIPLQSIGDNAGIESSARHSRKRTLEYRENQARDTSSASPTIEKSPLPISHGIFKRTVKNSKELTVVWTSLMDEDLLYACSLNKTNTIICIPQFEPLSLPESQKDLLTESETVIFKLLDSNDTSAPWNAIYFEEQICPDGLGNSCFGSIADVEKLLSEHAKSRGMVLTSVVRYSDESETFKCGLCDRTYWSLNNLKKHAKKKHNKQYRAATSAEVLKKDISDGSTECLKHLLMMLEKKEVQEMKHVEGESLAVGTRNDVETPETFKCALCTKTYLSLRALREHARKRHSRQYQTAISAGISKKDDSVVEHTQNKLETSHVAATSASKFSCKLCSNSYTSNSSLAAHIIGSHKDEADTIDNDTSFSCEQCPSSFPKYRSLGSHILKKHNEKSISNEVLNLGSSPITSIPSRAHVSLVEKEESSGKQVTPGSTTFKCKLCGKGQCSSKNSLQDHYRKYHPELVGVKTEDLSSQVRCEHCSMSFKNNAGMLTHTWRVHPEITAQRIENAAEVFACKFCPKKYDQQRCWVRHCQRQHNFTPKYTAVGKTEIRDSLNTSTPTRNNVPLAEKGKSSQKQVTPGSTGQVRCEYCPTSFKNNGGMKHHMRIAHPEQSARRIESASEVFACKFCPKKYDRQTSWLRHCQTAHKCTPKYTPVSQKKNKENNETPKSVRITTASQSEQESSNNSEVLQCDKCDRVFSTVDFLIKHKLTHSIVRPSLTCNHCGELFKEMALLKQHKDQECGKESNGDISMEESREEASRKRAREENRNSNDDEVFPVEPPIKRFNVKLEPQSIDDQTDESINEILAASLIIKTEPVDSYQREQPYIPNMVVAQTYAPEVEQTQMFTPPMPPRTTSSTHRNDRTIQKSVDTVSEASDCLMIANQMIGNSTVFNRNSVSTPLPRVPVSPSVVSDFSSVSQRQQSIYNVPSLSSPLPVPTIEKSPLPLSAGIFTRTVQFPKELMIVWSYSMEEDLLSAVSLNKRNSILCVRELETLNLPKPQRDLLSKSKMVTFNMLDSSDTFTPWTAIYFGEENCPNGLKKKLFRSFSDVEKTLSEHANTRGMTMNSVMRYTEDGLFPLLSNNLNQKLVVFNFVD